MDAQVIIVGAGPNGLFAACRLAREGLKVLVVEAKERPGGALWTAQSTLPGFHHDVGAGFVAFRDTVAFQALGLDGRAPERLSWGFGRFESAHPAPDGSVAAISQDPELTAAHFGCEQDGERWLNLLEWHRRIDPTLLAFLGPLLPMGAVGALLPFDGPKLGAIFSTSPAVFSRWAFRGEAARRVLPGLGMHVDIGPHDLAGTGIGYMLGLRAACSGFAVPLGGARRLTEALLAELVAHGGQVLLSREVSRVVVQRGRARGVVCRGGEALRAPVVVCDTSAQALYLRLLEGAFVPPRVRRAMERFPMGWGTFKLDLALSGPVPWRDPVCRDASVVHLGDSIEDLSRFTQQVRGGALPEQPYLVIGQHSLVDPDRAPVGAASLYVYSRVPTHLDARYPGGWSQWRERFADRVEARIEAQAPGFRSTVLGRATHTPADLERMSANLVGGDLGGGSNQWHRQLFNRPVFPYFRYRTPAAGVYLCSSFTHPGTGVHGMCGWNAAGAVLEDL